MSVKFQYSKLIMEKFLRRSFYDAVLRLYETGHGARIISVSLEGHLTLVVNKNENFIIKLNEVAQRADDVEEAQQFRLAKFMGFKGEADSDGYVEKKEAGAYNEVMPPIPTNTCDDHHSGVVVNLDDHLKDESKFLRSLHSEAGALQYQNNDQKLGFFVQGEPGTTGSFSMLPVGSHEQRGSGLYDQPSGSQMEGEHSVEAQQSFARHTRVDLNDSREMGVSKHEMDSSGPEEICFLPMDQVDGSKRKFEFSYEENNQLLDKKSPQKKRRLAAFLNSGEDLSTTKLDNKERSELTVAGETSDLNANSLQLLPHTATAPNPSKAEDDSNYTSDVATSEDQDQKKQQQQQIASLLQIHDQVGTIFRAQDLEELARQQQQQWQMLAYQRSIMEKSYLQQQMQQYQRGSDRLRWEFVAQSGQPNTAERSLVVPASSSTSPPTSQQLSPACREFISSAAVPGMAGDATSAEFVDKLYRHAQANPEAVLLALEEAKMSSAQEGQGSVEESVGMGDKLALTSVTTSQYIRNMLEDHGAHSSVQQQPDLEFEEGELRHDAHICVLCGIKFMSDEPLIRHMEKHRVAFERSCSVCQSGTLTGNMLKLHMEASHGPETSFPLPSLAAVAAIPPTIITSTSGLLSSSVPKFSSQPFQNVLQTGYPSTLQLELAGIRLAQQPHTLKQVAALLSKEDNEVLNAASTSNSSASVLKSDDIYKYDEDEEEDKSPPRADRKSSEPSTSQQASQEKYLGISVAQFFPLVACQLCGEKFALSEALDQHVESQHGDTAGCTYTCKPCCLSFETHVEYSKHLKQHEAIAAEGMASLSTNVTVSPSSSASSTTSPSTSSTTTPPSTSTNVSPSSATTGAALSQLKCSHCLKTFKSVKQLRLHYIAAHACCHFCEYCRAGFPDATSLELHEQLHTQDPDKLSYRCDICSKAFYTQSQCSAHKRTHKDEKAHACEVCGSSFFKRGDLTKHVRTVHSPRRLFSCKFCGKKGTRMDNMRSHVRSHHRNMTRDQIVNMIEVIE